MKESKKVLKLCCGVTAVTLSLSFVPPVSIGVTHMRKVDMLSGLRVKDDMPAAADSVKERKKVLANGTYASDTWPDSVTIIEDYSHGSGGGMAHFYAALNRRRSLQRPVRIAFLGDSFIEGDILAGDLREMLQCHFGGNGIGWIDAADKRNGVRPTIKIETRGLTDHQIRNKNVDYGLCGFQMRYTTLGADNSIVLQGSKYKPHAATWQKAIMYISCASSTPTRVSIGAQPEHTDTIAPSDQMQEITYRGHTGSMALSLSPVCAKGNILYGVALEPPQGVVVDNFSIRGFSGDAICKASKSVMRQFARLREYDLIILEYGLNNANDKNTDLHYRVYMNKMKGVIALMRELYPDASVLVMGVPDRSRHTADGFETMPCIETMTSWQRQLASSQKVAFYSLYQAMGGRNSMREYVDHKDANKDYTHLTLSGGERLAKRIYRSILTGLNNYNTRNK